MTTNNEYKLIPGRGLLTKSAIQMRLDYLHENGFETSQINQHLLDYNTLQNNIESFIGTVEIPMGIVGPLLFLDNANKEYVYTAAATLEGALVASMNRGAKAISMSGGYKATLVRKQMVRAPLFIFNTAVEADQFEKWIEAKFEAIKTVAEKYSNHAKLIALNCFKKDNNVHVKFTYTTGDASGQNMTTTCTWHAMLWIIEDFHKDTDIQILHYVIEGNGSSDKKISQFLIDHGRGAYVVAECFLDETIIKKVLRTSADDMYRFFLPAIEIAKQDGMLSFNINVANAIAAIYAATGQDLASIHESSLGLLNIKKENNGLSVSLTLPSLVIGTVGGGTHLPKQKEALDLMKCKGTGKAERFAKLIAGFALSLELSTFAAIVSGEFAKAHEKLGRNKPVNWLQKNELTSDFLKKCLTGSVSKLDIDTIEVSAALIDNGILTNSTKRVTKKITGFVPITFILKNNTKLPALIKSKALDIEVIKGLHQMAASIDPQLSDLIVNSKDYLEYKNCHLKELKLNQLLHEAGFRCTPFFYGNYINTQREIYFLFQEQLDPTQLSLIDSENYPQLWSNELIKKCILAIHKVHVFFATQPAQEQIKEVTTFEPWKSKAFYSKLAEIVCSENEDIRYQLLAEYIKNLEEDHQRISFLKTVIHNDFNPRNIAIRSSGEPCIYDWELAVLNFPHRDIIELLCFTLPLNFTDKQFLPFIEYHYELTKEMHPELNWKDAKKIYSYALKEFLVTRAAYYKAAEVLFRLKFAERIMLNAFDMIKLLEE